MIGTLLGNYRLESEVGSGGMGTVYRARHEVLGRSAAVKLLRADLVTSPELLTRFANEAKAASTIRHPNIVEVYDFGHTDDDRAYIVMEFLHGESLAQRVSRGALPPGEAVAIARGIADALGAAHQKGIVHRDLKPDNVFLVPDPDLGERPKLLDFGIAKLAEATTRYTQTGALIGTPMYMAPEQARAAKAIDHRADLYSLGCMFYEMLTGKPPFSADGAGEIIALHMFGKIEPPNVSPDLDAIVLRLLEKEPHDRFQHAAQVLAALDKASTAVATRPRSDAATTREIGHPFGVPTLAEPRRSRLPIVAAALTVLVAGVAAGAFVWLRRTDDAAPVAHPAAPAPPSPIVETAPPPPFEAPPPTPAIDAPPPPPIRATRPAKHRATTTKGSPIENEP